MARRRSSWGWGYSYTTADEVHSSSSRTLADARKKGLDYHPVVIDGKQIARTWWGKSWCANLERYADYANRLPRGRSYVRNNAVVDLVLEENRARAKVQGSSLYYVDIRFDPLKPKKEKELGKACSEQIQNIEQLLSGSFPESLKDLLFSRDALFPSPGEIHFHCSCPDWAYMCKHVAAVMYGIGARLDDEPIRFFDLRGIQTDDFIAKAVENRVESMLNHAACKSSRIIDNDELQSLFGLDISAPVMKPADDSSAVPAAPEPELRPAAVSAADRRKVRSVIQDSGYADKTKRIMLELYERYQSDVFEAREIARFLKASYVTGCNYIKRFDELHLIEHVPQETEIYRFLP